MAAQIDALRGKVQRILTEKLGTVEIDKDGDFTVRHESTRAFVSCREWGDKTLVVVHAPFLGDVPPSPELFKYVATEGGLYHFGHVTAWEQGGTCTLSFRHTLLGDYLDGPELEAALVAVAVTANDLDDELQQRFGGRRFHEDG